MFILPPGMSTAVKPATNSRAILSPRLFERTKCPVRPLDHPCNSLKTKDTRPCRLDPLLHLRLLPVAPGGAHVLGGI